MKVVKLFILIIFLFITNSAFSQLEKTIDSLQKIEKACLDNGRNMPYCSYVYMQEMDSLLNLVYSNLKSSLDSIEQKNLKIDELNWIKKKDLYFKEIDKEYTDNLKSGDWGKDMRMVSYQEKSDFIEKRVLVLIKKNNQLSESNKYSTLKGINELHNFIHFFRDTGLAELVAAKLNKKITDNITPKELSSIQGSFEVGPGEVKDLTGIGYLNGIDTFSCYKNEVAEIPSEIGQLTKLKYLDLNKAFSLNTIPHEIGQLRELKMIRLSLTEVRSIPHEIGNLENLEVLWMGNNKINEIPKEIGNLKKLLDLDISSNSFKLVPDEICNLTALTKLMITHCGLESLPENIGNLKNLETLNLNNNNLKYLPESIAHLTRLTYLNVLDNKQLSESYKKYMPESLQKKKAVMEKY
jgi:Leucine-rich repeat (LRR) protein